jgi:hypothetical protein
VSQNHKLPSPALLLSSLLLILLQVIRSIREAAEVLTAIDDYEDAKRIGVTSGALETVSTTIHLFAFNSSDFVLA